MPFCSNCGMTLEKDDKFCSACGEKTDDNLRASQQYNASKRSHRYVGDIRKCPSCGSDLTSYAAICPDCGHELNSLEVSTTLQEFIDELENYDTLIYTYNDSIPKTGWSTWNNWKKFGWILMNLYLLFTPLLVSFLYRKLKSPKSPILTKEMRRKVKFIENYPFPNERSALLDGLIFCKEKTSYYFIDELNQNSVFWINLWIKKFEALYCKAEMLFPLDPEIKKLQSGINDYKIIVNKYKRKKAIHNALTIGIVIIIILLFSKLMSALNRAN